MMRRILNMLNPARVTLVDDTGPIQFLQVDEGPIGPDGSRRIIDKVPRIQEFGSASNPPIGSELLLGRFGGDRSQSIAKGSNHQPSRLRNLAPGDKAIYDVRGAYVWLTASGPVIDAAGGKVTIRNATNITITGSAPITVTAPHVNVVSNDVNLGDTGGQPVARVGDAVDLGTGLILAGSPKVKAA